MNNCKVLAFDMDDTLYPEAKFVESGFRAVDEYASKKYEIKDFHNQALSLFKSGVRTNIFDRILLKLKVKNHTEIVKEFLEVYRNHKPKIFLHEDAKWALDFFSKNKKLVLISDGYLKVQSNKFKALKISSYFDRPYFTDEWGKSAWKPSLYVFKKIEEDYSVEGSNCVYIADNPRKDFIAPNILGWQSIQIKRPGGEYFDTSYSLNGKPHHVIETLYELKEI